MLLRGTSTTEKQKLTEPRPDSPFVVFYGLPSEAQPAELTGKLVLTSAESMPVRSIKMTLCGMRKVSYGTTTKLV